MDRKEMEQEVSRRAKEISDAWAVHYHDQLNDMKTDARDSIIRMGVIGVLAGVAGTSLLVWLF
jgi:hypothetical protein